MSNSILHSSNLGKAFRGMFSRISVSTRFVPELDGLRFIAIGCVVFYHLLGIISVRRFGEWKPELFDGIWPLNWLTHGHFGVPLFFTISGFILAIPFARHHLEGAPVFTLPKYYLRRLARLGPPYLIWLLILFIAKCLTQNLTLDNWPNLLASLFYVHNPIYGQGSLVSVLAWSLEVEVQFYLIAPFLAHIFTIHSPLLRRLLLVACTLGAAVAAEVFMPGNDPWTGNAWRISVLNYLHYFLVGFLLADIYLTSWKNQASTTSRWVWEVAGIGAWCFIWTQVDAGSIARLCLPLAVFVAYAGAFRGILVNRFVRIWWIYTIGGMCYTIYLWHQPMMMTWGKFGLPHTWNPALPLGANVAVQFAICGILVAAGGAVLFVLTERPFMKREWYRSIFPRRLLKCASSDESTDAS